MGRIAEKSCRNLRRAFLMVEACKVAQYPFSGQQEIQDLDWELYLRETANQIVQEQSPRKVSEIRSRLYELYGAGVERLRIEQPNFLTPSKKKIEISTIASNYHIEQSQHLELLVKGGDFPHLLVYGPPGAGKKTRVMCLLREMYGAVVERLRIEHQNFETPSKKKVEITTIASNYHIEVNPSDCGIYDRVVIQELIKTVAGAHQLNTEGQREFKVVILTEVDRLTKDAQHALRRTMEKYMATCRVMLVTNSTSKVIPAIRSRCLAVRVAAPSYEDVA